MKFNYNDLENMSPLELRKLSRGGNIGIKAITSFFLEEENEEVIEFSKQEPKLYLEQIEIYLKPKNSKYLLPISMNLFLEMFKSRFMDGMYHEWMIKELFQTPSFNQYSDEYKEEIVQTLLIKNQLKSSTNFLRNKIEDNLLLAKIKKEALQFSFGLKHIDDSLNESLGSEFSDYLEIGWVNNNGDKKEFRESFSDFLNKLSGQKVLALIRQENSAAINLVSEFNFKFIKKIKSPYSYNTLALYVL